MRSRKAFPLLLALGLGGFLLSCASPSSFCTYWDMGGVERIQAPPVARVHEPVPVLVTVTLPDPCHRVAYVSVSSQEFAYVLQPHLELCALGFGCPEVLTSQTVEILLTFPSPGVYLIRGRKAFSSETVVDTIQIIP